MPCSSWRGQPCVYLRPRHGLHVHLRQHTVLQAALCGCVRRCSTVRNCGLPWSAHRWELRAARVLSLIPPQLSRAQAERLGSHRVCEQACGADGCWLPVFAGQLPHSITALAVQKDLTFAAVRTDILVCQRVHWCAAQLARVARLHSGVNTGCPRLARRCSASCYPSPAPPRAALHTRVYNRAPKTHGARRCATSGGRAGPQCGDAAGPPRRHPAAAGARRTAAEPGRRPAAAGLGRRRLRRAPGARPPRQRPYASRPGRARAAPESCAAPRCALGVALFIAEHVSACGGRACSTRHARGCETGRWCCTAPQP